MDRRRLGNPGCCKHFALFAPSLLHVCRLNTAADDVLQHFYAFLNVICREKSSVLAEFDQHRARLLPYAIFSQAVPGCCFRADCVRSEEWKLPLSKANPIHLSFASGPRNTIPAQPTRTCTPGHLSAEYSPILTPTTLAYDHTPLRTRHPVRSVKLSNGGPS